MSMHTMEVNAFQTAQRTYSRCLLRGDDFDAARLAALESAANDLRGVIAERRRRCDLALDLLSWAEATMMSNITARLVFALDRADDAGADATAADVTAAVNAGEGAG